MEKVKETTSKSKSSAPPKVDEQPTLPEKMNRPEISSHSPGAVVNPQPDGMPPIARASDLLASPDGDLGAPTRARIGSMMQRQVGNARVGRTLGASVQTKLTVGSPGDVQEQEADQVAGEVGKTSSATTIQRQPADGSAKATSAPTPSSDLALTPHDEIITASLLQTLERFKNIPIFVGFKPLPPDLIGPPEPVIVNVHAQYYNNKSSAAREGIRNQNEAFPKIKKRLKDLGVMSVLKGGEKHLLAGRAVEVGKASPEDIKAFVETAISEGIIENYARSHEAHRKLRKGQKLVDLPRDDLQKLIQGW
jgi:hypothetical protein